MSILSSIKSFATGLYSDVKQGLSMNPEILALPLASVPAIATATATKAGQLATATGNLIKNAYSSLKPTTKLGLGIAAIPVSSAVISSPTLQKNIVNAPSSLYTFGGNIGKIVENPSLSTVKQTFKDNPFISSAAVLGTAGVIGYGTSSLIASAANTAAVKANTAASNITSSNPILGSETNRKDRQIAEINAESQLALLKEQGKQQEESFKQQLKLLEAQSKLTPTSNTPIAATPTVATVTKKKTTKKRTSKKKKKTKTIKRKTTHKKKKTTKRKKR